MQKIADSIQSTAEKLRDQLANGVHDSGAAAKDRSVGVTIALIKLQRSMFDRSFKVLARLEKYSDKLMKKHVQGANWMPAEGKDIVKEWNQMLNDGRVEFQKTVDKSYDLLTDCLERIRKEQASVGKKTAAAVSAKVSKAKSATRAKIVTRTKSAAKSQSAPKKSKRPSASTASAFRHVMCAPPSNRRQA